VKLTGSIVAKLELPAGKAEAFVWDDDLPGFGLRLRAGGKRTWVVQYRLGTKQRRVSIGTPGALTAEKARKTAAEILAKVRLGQDFQAQKHKARAEAALTLGAMVIRYIAEHVERRQRPGSQLETKRHLEKHWKPLHGLPLAEVDRRLVADRLGRLARDSGPIAANRARGVLSALFAWAIKQGLADSNPVTGTDRPGEEVSRQRVLSLPELAELWRANGEDDYGWIVRLLILTGQRREEVAAMRWSELDLKSASWSLPGERTKNKQPHEVPLSAAAMQILRAVPRRIEVDAAGKERERDLLFGRDTGPFQGWGRARARLDRRLLAARREAAKSAGQDLEQVKPPAQWTLHDIRRSVVTHMNELSIAPHVVEAVVNHVSGAAKAGVAGIYNRATYLPEKAAALARWADRLATEVEGGEPKVVPMWA
jgi:integrase